MEGPHVVLPGTGETMIHWLQGFAVGINLANAVWVVALQRRSRH